VDTLSPCESITSDDLMLDYERSEGSIFDCTAERYCLLQPCSKVLPSDQPCKSGVTFEHFGGFVPIMMAAYQP
jgi:hypothetical protein